jgi:hypothetical protein
MVARKPNVAMVNVIPIGETRLRLDMEMLRMWSSWDRIPYSPALAIELESQAFSYEEPIRVYRSAGAKPG